MKNFWILCCLNLLSAQLYAIPESIYIRASQINASAYEYNIEFSFITYYYYNTLYDGFDLRYGDGTHEEIKYADFEHRYIDPLHEKYTYLKKHAFPGPGTYKISLRVFNRTPDIENMAHSVNSPLYVETTLILDPFLGGNSMPELENFPFGASKTSQRYFYDISINDVENDSISFQLITPLQDKDTYVTDYWRPVEMEALGSRRISKIQQDPYNGTLLWNTNALAGLYSLAFRVNEWRKVEGEYYLISSAIIDYELFLHKSTNEGPELHTFPDSVIVVDNAFSPTVVFSDPENDSIHAFLSGELLHLMGYNQEGNTKYLPSPVEKSFSFTPGNEHVRIKPYKAVFSVLDGAYYSASSSYIWVTDRAHEPGPPQEFFGQALTKDLVTLYWEDTDEELGYILERSEDRFPNFERIAVLPPNTTYFNDLGVVEHTTYNYRITAVGTKMAEYRSAEVTTPDIITALGESGASERICIYPNPNDGTFTISHIPMESRIEIRDLTGRLVWKKKMIGFDGSDSMEINNKHFSKGTYMLTLQTDFGVCTHKVIIQ